jgi:hypothetical protein
MPQHIQLLLVMLLWLMLAYLLTVLLMVLLLLLLLWLLMRWLLKCSCICAGGSPCSRQHVIRQVIGLSASL